mmetsp:Transcript_108274/g.337422  ORF Transcript_108274/g.337422 Transcript_108274/m.337422 type:complete len:138 (+) Transcript_108274:54-467(+)|eukprot:CAMPEP_0204602730 /NCGR_PEP_ID=MMETSP0661-20131031/56832_1 /ASSEMBLY_ACC=CAM_ASM_000606 /TAXON_ID=109239 /ORGANISM="Alexandrium margalefi, Strain AMGDE01CS-322" /LENGTH=137 /DNA_ID=CAMNT_0051613725 /DNA_START=36 /DNA_END=449 /DNA_ORIENTATION=+
MSGQWSTGLFTGIFDDFYIFVGAALGGCLMPVQNAYYVDTEKSIFGADTLFKPCVAPFKSTGCVSPGDEVWCGNCCMFCFLQPIVAFLWRGQLRQKYGIEGNALGDCCACWMCGFLATMQGAREIRSKGNGYQAVPK